MEPADWSNLEFFFKDRLVEDFTTVEEELRKIRECRSRRSKRASESMVFCIVVKSQKRYKGMYIRAILNGLALGTEPSAEIRPESFLVGECSRNASHDGVFFVKIEIWSLEGMVSEETFRITSLDVFSKKLGFLRLIHKGVQEEIEVEIHCVQTDGSGSQAYDDMKAIGHRGCGENRLTTTNLMENTISSFLEAYRRGAKWVEMDVQLTKDEVPVVFHDFGIQTGGSYAGINEVTLEEFLSLVGNPDEKEHHLPCTLSKLLDQIGNEHGINIEIKYPLPSEEREHGLRGLIPAEKVVERIVETVQRSGRQKVIFSSFHPYVLLLLKLRLPSSNIYMLTEANNNKENPYTGTLYDALYFSAKLGLDGVVLDWNCISASPIHIVKAFESFDLKTIVYGSGVNNRDVIHILNEAGVHGIILDNLDLAYTNGNGIY
ncbi:similarity to GLYCEROPHOSPHORYLDIESTER PHOSPHODIESTERASE [Encephalitozoon cuniculi GB-M1]|uniref:Similarity to GLYCEROPHOSPHORYLDIESTER PHOSPHODIESTERASE n=1 Tax=Encephalitozoon cuniculi (strain GB-M1) TaxID=284813 RepID=Q8SWI0_ENCCU|nr:uncharacterized protein ECU01_1380 [Encephalitozoon cuniculi GB-M1]CAD25011.1 similarity to GLYCEROPHOSPHORYLDIESTER PHOSPHODIESTERASE [Encephalitozoon cuniculi GB-M1]